MIELICFSYNFSESFTTSIYGRRKCATDLNGIGDMISKNSSETTMNIKIMNTDKAVKKINKSLEIFSISDKKKNKRHDGYITF